MRIRAGVGIVVAAVIGAVTLAGCGGGSTEKTAARGHCVATVGFAGPLRESLGRQQLAFARLAVATDNAAERTRITLVPADTDRQPSLAAGAADHFAAGKIVAVIGPVGDREVQEVGPVFARAGLAFISPSATGAMLTDGANPTFFRVVPSDELQGFQMARFVATRLRPRSVMLIDDQQADSRKLVSGVADALRAAKVPVVRQTAIEGVTPLSSVASRITPAISTVVLAWHAPAAAQQLQRILIQQRKVVTLVVPSVLFAPGLTVPRSFAASPVPDVTALPANASLVRRAERSVGRFGIGAPPAYAAAQVIDSAVAAVCRTGHIPSRSGVLAAIRSTDLAGSILGIPIKFRTDGNLTAGRWFMFRVEPDGGYAMLPGQ